VDDDVQHSDTAEQRRLEDLTNCRYRMLATRATGREADFSMFTFYRCVLLLATVSVKLVYIVRETVAEHLVQVTQDMQVSRSGLHAMTRSICIYVSEDRQNRL
jgi:hypothetical protein